MPDIPPSAGGEGDYEGYFAKCGTQRSKQLVRSVGGIVWNRKLYLNVTWCARYGAITSWSAYTFTDHGSFCHNVNPAQKQKTHGGIGSAFVEIQAWVEVECASIPTNWPKWNDTLLMRVRYYQNGVYDTVFYS